MASNSTFKSSKEAEEVARYLTNYVAENKAIVSKVGKDTVKYIESVSKGTKRKKNEVDYPVEWANSEKKAIAAAKRLKKYYGRLKLWRHNDPMIDRRQKPS
jgi:hypothetical protein